jgi:uncharacterized protein YgbK (DUF1537 family)
MRFVVIADDVTGAALTAAKMRTALPSVNVYLRLPALLTSADRVSVISTDSRRLSSDAAWSRVESVARAAVQQADIRIGKFVDSALRGHVRAEIEAVLGVTPVSHALVVPAQPDAGRITRGGRHYVMGVPVHETSLGRDPLFPLPDSEVVRIMGPGTVPVAAIPISTVRAGPEHVRREVERVAPGIVVCDAETEEDLDALAEAAVEGPFLPAGSASFLAAFARRLFPDYQRAPVLLIIGTRMLATLQQLHEVTAAGAACLVSVDIESALRDGTVLSGLVDRARSLLRAGRSVALTVVPAVTAPRDTAWIIGQLVVNLGLEPLAGLLVSGGDTAALVLSALDAEGLEIVGEIPGGVVQARVLGGLNHRLAFATKSGAAGGPAALADAIRYLQTCKD